MIIGIDAGGTNTDGVVISDSQIVTSIKVPSTPNSVEGIKQTLTALKEQMRGEPGEVERIVIGTTLILNAAVEKKMRECGCLLLPGPGLNPALAKKGDYNKQVAGYIDHSGKKVENLDKESVKAFKTNYGDQIDVFAIVGKFSPRNPLLERQAAKIFDSHTLSMGHEVSSKLNFPKRAASTVLNAKSKPIFHQFTHNIEAVLRELSMEAPLFFIKSDGAMLNKKTASNIPAMTIKSGPAVSTLGLFALTGVKNAVAVDIGGTTTDLGIINEGTPKKAPQLAIESYETCFSSVQSVDIPLGGDSLVGRDAEGITIQPYRKDRAAAFGGKFPTPTDALHVLNQFTAGDVEKARDAISKITPSDSTPQHLSQKIMHQFVERIATAIEAFIARQTGLHQTSTLVGGGALAKYVLPKIAGKIGHDYIVPTFFEVAGAVGCAVSKVSLTTGIHINTAQGQMTVNGKQKRIERGKRFDPDALRKLARKQTKRVSKAAGGTALSEEHIQINYLRYFNVVEQRRVQGQICDVQAQVEPGISSTINLQQLRGENET